MSSIQITVDKLKSVSAVTSVTGKGGIYPIAAKQTSKPPFAVCNIADTRDRQMLDGAGKFYTGRVQVDCIGLTPTSAVSLGDNVLAALEDVVKETVGDFTGVDIMFADTDFTDHSNDMSTYRRVLHFLVTWR